MTQIKQKADIENRPTIDAPLEYLRNNALKHYEEASNSIKHGSSFVVDAIKAYDPKQIEMLKRENAELKAELDTIKKHIEIAIVHLLMREPLTDKI